jgi:diacylglycerol kinase
MCPHPLQQQRKKKKRSLKSHSVERVYIVFLPDFYKLETLLLITIFNLVLYFDILYSSFEGIIDTLASLCLNRVRGSKS